MTSSRSPRRPGLIDLIGDWVIDAVLAQGEAWIDAGLNPMISFNVSPRQLRRRGFWPDLGKRIVASRQPAAQLSVEITESVTMEEANVSFAALEEFHDLGVKIAIDDFGADFSSLGRLRDMPVDLLKIDRSFLRGVPERPKAAAIVTAIQRLGEALDMRAIAEGVETPEQLAFLVEQGCPLAQGFHLGRPMLPKQATAVLAAARPAQHARSLEPFRISHRGTSRRCPVCAPGHTAGARSSITSGNRESGPRGRS